MGTRAYIEKNDLSIQEYMEINELHKNIGGAQSDDLFMKVDELLSGYWEEDSKRLPIIMYKTGSFKETSRGTSGDLRSSGSLVGTDIIVYAKHASCLNNLYSPLNGGKVVKLTIEKFTNVGDNEGVNEFTIEYPDSIITGIYRLNDMWKIIFRPSVLMSSSTEYDQTGQAKGTHSGGVNYITATTLKQE